jgi:hypothetical protein
MAIVSGMAVSGPDTKSSAAVRSPGDVEDEIRKVTRALHLLELVRSRGSSGRTWRAPLGGKEWT